MKKDLTYTPKTMTKTGFIAVMIYAQAHLTCIHWASWNITKKHFPNTFDVSFWCPIQYDTDGTTIRALYITPLYFVPLFLAVFLPLYFYNKRKNKTRK